MMQRRDFFKLLALGSLAAGAGFKSAFAAAQPHVVVVGGGVGGATFAKYLKLSDQNIKVTLIERNPVYLRPFGSSEVVVGHIGMKDLEVRYDALRDKYGVEVVIDSVTGMDFNAKTVSTASGKQFGYDRLVVSPGITFDLGSIEGLTTELTETRIPHAWIPGKQTELLASQLKAMRPGGVVAVGVPQNPYRCPPGPYERAGLMTEYLMKHNPTAKVLVLDAKNAFTTDVTMLQAWNRLFGFNVPKEFKGYDAFGGRDKAQLVTHDKPSMIEWVMGEMGGRVVGVDAANGLVKTEGGDIKADVINIIPPHKGGELALSSGLADTGPWCSVDPMTFESKVASNVHVLGDSCVAGDMPKSGYSASAQAKVAALQIRNLLAGQPVMDPVFQNTCYALAGSSEYGQFVADVFRVKEGRITRLPNPRYLPLDANPVKHKLSATYTEAWMETFVEDSFG